MKVGDIVTVHDGSWSMAIVNGVLKNVHGDALLGRQFRALSFGGQYPTTDHGWSSIPRNDMMAVDTKDHDFVLFTRPQHCSVVQPVPRDTMEITIPPWVVTVTLRFENR